MCSKASDHASISILKRAPCCRIEVGRMPMTPLCVWLNMVSVKRKMRSARASHLKRASSRDEKCSGMGSWYSETGDEPVSDVGELGSPAADGWVSRTTKGWGK